MFYFRFKKKIEKMSESLISSFLVSDVSEYSFGSNQMSDVSESLISLTKNERPWAIHSGHSEKMSNVSKSLTKKSE